VLNFETGFEDIEKVLNLTKCTSGIEKVWNSKFNHLFIQIFFCSADHSSADVFCIVFYQQNFRKMNLNDCIEVF